MDTTHAYIHTYTSGQTHLLHFLAPENLVDDQDDLGGPVKQPLVTSLSGVRIHRVLQDGAQLIAHLDDDVIQVLLHLCVCMCVRACECVCVCVRACEARSPLNGHT